MSYIDFENLPVYQKARTFRNRISGTQNIKEFLLAWCAYFLLASFWHPIATESWAQLNNRFVLEKQQSIIRDA